MDTFHIPLASCWRREACCRVEGASAMSMNSPQRCHDNWTDLSQGNQREVQTAHIFYFVHCFSCLKVWLNHVKMVVFSLRPENDAKILLTHRTNTRWRREECLHPGVSRWNSLGHAPFQSLQSCSVRGQTEPRDGL